MSIQAVAWVLEQSQAEGLARLVLISLANHANADSEAWPSMRTIAREARIRSVATVHASIGQLQALGELEVTTTGTNRRSHRYRLTYRPGGAAAPVDNPPVDNPPAFGQRSPGERSVRPGANAAFGPERTESLGTVKNLETAPHRFPCVCSECHDAIVAKVAPYEAGPVTGGRGSRHEGDDAFSCGTLSRPGRRS